MMTRKLFTVAIVLQAFIVMGCSAADPAQDGSSIDRVEQELQGTHLYFRCNATGFQPTPATRLTPTAQAGVYSLSYTVNEAWMISGFDHCSFTETNQLDGWGTFQGHYGADGGNPITVPASGRIRKDGADWFNVRYPALGAYTIDVRWPSGDFTIRPSAQCSPATETCNGIDDDCDGLVDESYLCMPAATAPAIDELITQCPRAAVLSAIDQDFDIRFEFSDQNGDGVLDDPAPEGNALRCTTAAGSRNLTQSQERTYQALIALRALDFDPSLPFTNLNLYAWARASLRGIRIRSDISGSFCCTPPDGASGNYINIQNDANRSAYFTDLWTNNSGLGLFSMVQLLVHEIRHANGPLHTCGGDDQTIGELGAWGSVYHFARALAFDSNPCFLRPSLPPSPEFPGQLFAPDSYLIDARNYARGLHTTRFCSEPSLPVEPPEPVVVCGG